MSFNNDPGKSPWLVWGDLSEWSVVGVISLIRLKKPAAWPASDAISGASPYWELSYTTTISYQPGNGFQHP